MTNDIQFVPSFSLQPNKLTLFNTIYKKHRYTGEWLHSSKFRNYTNLKNNNSEPSPDDRVLWHKLKISDNAYRTIKSRINWLYYLAQKRTVTTPKGKEITNFKIAFITLTLPAKQKQPTAEITSDLLNQFLTECRGRFKMHNYVWRLEFQKNGNVHYHIVTDTYIDFFKMKSIWNRIIDKKGYIKDYQKKMSNLSLNDYFNKYYGSDITKFDKCKEHFAKSKQENWLNPPTINVKSVVSNKSIAGYLSKYFAKDSKSEVIKNELDNISNTQNLRLWFCSRSLSKLKAVSDFCEAVKYDIFAIVSYCADFFEVQMTYAKVIFFDIEQSVGNPKDWLNLILRKYAKRQRYKPAGAV